MGTERIIVGQMIHQDKDHWVKLNNPLMGTER